MGQDSVSPLCLDPSTLTELVTFCIPDTHSFWMLTHPSHLHGYQKNVFGQRVEVQEIRRNPWALDMEYSLFFSLKKREKVRDWEEAGDEWWLGDGALHSLSCIHSTNVVES